MYGPVAYTGTTRWKRRILGRSALPADRGGALALELQGWMNVIIARSSSKICREPNMP